MLFYCISTSIWGKGFCKLLRNCIFQKSFFFLRQLLLWNLLPIHAYFLLHQKVFPNFFWGYSFISPSIIYIIASLPFVTFVILGIPKAFIEKCFHFSSSALSNWCLWLLYELFFCNADIFLRKYRFSTLAHLQCFADFLIFDHSIWIFWFLLRGHKVFHSPVRKCLKRRGLIPHIGYRFNKKR